MQTNHRGSYPCVSALVLNPGDIHLWICVPEKIQDPELLATYGHLLDEFELLRMARFHFAEHRRQYVISRAMLRTILSCYDGVTPVQRRLVYNRFGKPEIAKEQNLLDLKFNLSHTSGMIVCGVTLYDDLGVDVENHSTHHELVEIADRYFSPQEIFELKRHPAAERGRCFSRFWTLKESYVKARGEGLYIPLSNFSFSMQRNKKITVSFAKELADNPDDWSFLLMEPSGFHTVALAVRTKNRTTSIQLVTRETIPLRMTIARAKYRFRAQLSKLDTGDSGHLRR